jgi:hypothetical protein
MGEDLKALVPRVLGQTEAARRKKSADRGGSKQWDEPSFFEALRQRRGEQEEAVARRLLAWAKGHGLRIWWGKGKKDGSFFPMYDNKLGKNFLFSVWTYGAVELQFQHMKVRPFSAPEQRRGIANRLTMIDGVSIPDTALDKRPSFGLGHLARAGSLDRFLDAFDWVLSEIRGSESRLDADRPDDRPQDGHPESPEYGTSA